MLNAFVYLAVTAACCFGIHFFGFQRRKRNWERTSLLAFSASLVAVLILRCCAEFQWGSWDWLFIGIQTVFDVLEGNSCDFRTALSALPIVPEVLSCVVPALAVFTAARLLWNYLPHHDPFFKKEWYLFSELDSNSVRMAKDLSRSDNLCIFLRTRRDKADPELLTELGEIPFFLYPGSEIRFLRCRRRRRHIMRFFYLSENTDENFDRMQDFLKAVSKRNLFKPVGDVQDDVFQQELYLLSETESAPMLIGHLRSMMKDVPCFKNTELRLLDRYRAISYDLLRSKPLHRHIRDGKLNILVLGFGKIGREFFRTACALSILHGCETEFTLCDQQIGAKLAAFVPQCPELHESVTFHSRKLNLDTVRLEKLIAQHDYHYILVALGDDERNIRVASRLKRFYRLRHWEQLAGKRTDDIQPQICVNIEDAIKHAYTVDLWKDDKTGHTLHVFGGLDQVFTQRVLMPRNLWNAARFIHRELNSMQPSERLNWGEYERRSSIACAVRAEYLAAFQPTATPAALADTEHLRWMAYVRSEGLRYADTDLVDVYYDSSNGKHVDILGKLTPCLTKDQKQLEIVWKRLSEETHPDDYRDKRSFRQRDECLVALTTEIAGRAAP